MNNDRIRVKSFSLSKRNGGTTNILLKLMFLKKDYFNDTPPWFLFQYIGDPDELNLYKFTKVK